MEYAYAALILHENGEEINETNLKRVLSAAGGDIIESRTKAFVAALEDVDLDRVAEGDASLSVPDVASNGQDRGSAEDERGHSSGGGTVERMLNRGGAESGSGGSGRLSGLLDPLLESKTAADGSMAGSDPGDTVGEGGEIDGGGDGTGHESDSQSPRSDTERAESVSESGGSTTNGGTETDSTGGGS